jgi:Right handed beta helix region
MSYTLRGRLETRLAASAAPLLAAGAFALALRAWWPFAIAALMLAVGTALDATIYHRLLSYQPGWLALPLGFAELASVIGLARLLDVPAPLRPSLALFAGAWLLAQLLVHVALPLARLSYAEDGGELGRPGVAVAALVLGVLASAGGIAWALRPPTVRLEAGVHRGPLVLDHPQVLVGAPGAVVRDGIVITSNNVTVKDLTIVGGENAVDVRESEDVTLESVRIADARLDGIHVRQSSVVVRNCVVQSPPGGQGIDISFAMTLPPSLVEGCTVAGGSEGIVSHTAHVEFRDNEVTGTSLRGITVTEMSMGMVKANSVDGALGVGIFCGDYSVCEIEENSISNTRPDRASGDRTRLGYAIVAHYGASAKLERNSVMQNPRTIASFLHASISSE